MIKIQTIFDSKDYSKIKLSDYLTNSNDFVDNFYFDIRDQLFLDFITCGIQAQKNIVSKYGNNNNIFIKHICCLILCINTLYMEYDKFMLIPHTPDSQFGDEQNILDQFKVFIKNGNFIAGFDLEKCYGFIIIFFFETLVNLENLLAKDRTEHLDELNLKQQKQLICNIRRKFYCFLFLSSMPPNFLGKQFTSLVGGFRQPPHSISFSDLLQKYQTDFLDKNLLGENVVYSLRKAHVVELCGEVLRRSKRYLNDYGQVLLKMQPLLNEILNAERADQQKNTEE